MEENFYCDLCDIRCSGVEPYIQHMSSSKHKKKQEQKKLFETINNVERSFHCSTCGIACSGIVPYQQHLTSDKHLKKEQAKQLYEKYSSVLSNVPDCEISDSSSNPGYAFSEKDECNVSLTEAVDPALYAQTNFHCVVCEKQFTGIVPYEQHMNSTVHKKKLQKIELQSTLASGKIDISKNGAQVHKQYYSSTSMSDANNMVENSTLVETLFRCNLCEQGFPSQEIHDLHLLSSAHKTAQKALPSDDGYFCAVCNKKCTGSVPYVQHMNSLVHEKNLKKARLLASTSAGNYLEANTNSSDVKNVIQSTTEKSVENSTSSVLALSKLHHIGTVDTNSVLAECYVCQVKLYSSEEIKEHYESESHYDNQNIYEYKRKVKVFAPEEQFNP